MFNIFKYHVFAPMDTGQKQQLLDGKTVENKGKLILTLMLRGIFWDRNNDIMLSYSLVVFDFHVWNMSFSNQAFIKHSRSAILRQICSYLKSGEKFQQECITLLWEPLIRLNNWQPVFLTKITMSPGIEVTPLRHDAWSWYYGK